MRTAKGDESVKPFLEHLEDLRLVLIQCVIALAIGTCITFPFAPQILLWLQAPLMDAVGTTEPFLQSLEVTGAFSVAMRTAVWSGLLLAAPFVFFFIGKFVFPGLTEKEKSTILRSSGFAVVLFFIGVWVGYTITLGVAVKVMHRMHGWLSINAQWKVSSYVGFAIHLLIAFGVAFEMPVVLVVLGRLGIVTSTQLRERRRYVVVILLIVAMVLTPPDPFTQLAMAVPLYLLFEISIWIVRIWERKET